MNQEEARIRDTSSVTCIEIMESPFKQESSELPQYEEPIIMKLERNYSQEESMEILQGLLHRQETYYTPPSRYSVRDPLGVSSSRLAEDWRRIICEWIFDLVDNFDFERELVGIALEYLDRSVSRHSDGAVSTRDYKLAAIASVFLAIKLHSDKRSSSGAPCQIGLETLVHLSHDLFTEDMIQEGERKIAFLLDWHLNPPTSLQYITYFLRLCPMWPESGLLGEFSYRAVTTAVHHTAKYLAELASFSLALSFDTDASTVAYAALLSAVSIVQGTMRIPPKALRAWLQRLEEVHSSFSPSNEKVVMAQNTIKEINPQVFDAVKSPHLVTPTQRTEARLSPTNVEDFASVDVSPTKRQRTNHMEDALPDSSLCQS